MRRFLTLCFLFAFAVGFARAEGTLASKPLTEMSLVHSLSLYLKANPPNA